ncbi:hypothetical protein ABIA22_006649 [Sinorhizobium fredii]
MRIHAGWPPQLAWCTGGSRACPRIPRQLWGSPYRTPQPWKVPPMSSVELWTILWIMSSLAFGVFLALLTRRR